MKWLPWINESVLLVKKRKCSLSLLKNGIDLIIGSLKIMRNKTWENLNFCDSTIIKNGKCMVSPVLVVCYEIDNISTYIKLELLISEWKQSQVQSTASRSEGDSRSPQRESEGAD